MIESILVEDESSMLFSTGKLPEKQVFLCNRKFLGIPYYAKKTAEPDFLSPGCPNQQSLYVTALCNYITYTFTPYGMGNY